MANQNDSSLEAFSVDDEVFFGHVTKREQRVREKFEASIPKYSKSPVSIDDTNVKSIPEGLSVAHNEKKPNDNDSMYKSFSIDGSKYESFDDSLDRGLLENEKEVIPSFLNDQLNDNHRILTDRKKLKSKAFYDSLEDICSLASIVERCSISGESENFVNIVEQQLISEDSLKNSPAVFVENKSSSINENIHFDDDSLAILEFEKTFDDSLEELNLPTSFDVEKFNTTETNCLGNPDADELKAEKFVKPRNLFETSVEIVYEKLESLASVAKGNYLTDINKLNYDSLSNSDCNEAFKDSLEDSQAIFNILSCQGQNTSKNVEENQIVQENEFALSCNSEENIFEKNNGQKIVANEFFHTATVTTVETERGSANNIIKENCVLKCSEEKGKVEKSKVSERSKISSFKDTDKNKSKEEKCDKLISKSEFLEPNSMEANIYANDKINKAEDSKFAKLESTGENALRDKSDYEITYKSPFLKLEKVKENVSKKENELSEGTQESFDVAFNTKTPEKQRKFKSVKGNKSSEKKLYGRDKSKVLIKNHDLSSITLDQNVHDEGKEKEIVKEKNISSDEVDVILSAQKSEASVIHLTGDSQNQLEKNSFFSEISSDNGTKNFIINETEQNSYTMVTNNNFSDDIKIPTDFNIKLHIELTLGNGKCKVASKNAKLIPSSSPDSLQKCRINPFTFDKKPHKGVKNSIVEQQTEDLNIIESSIACRKKNIHKTCETESSKKIMSRRVSFGIHTEFSNENSVLLQALDLHDTSISFRSDASIQSRDSIMPLNLCLRDTSFFKKHNLVPQSESKENIPEHVQFHSGMKQYNSHCLKSTHKSISIETSKDPNHFESIKRNLRKPIFTKIPVRKVESFATPYTTPKHVSKEYKPMSSEKVKFIPSKEAIFCTTPVQKISSATSKKTHYCRTSSSSKLPKSAKVVSSKRFQNIESPVAKYIREMRACSPLKPIKPLDGLLNCLTHEVNHAAMETYGQSPYLRKNASAQKVTKRNKL